MSVWEDYQLFHPIPLVISLALLLFILSHNTIYNLDINLTIKCKHKSLNLINHNLYHNMSIINSGTWFVTWKILDTYRQNDYSMN
jgi:hypothetical protein